MPRQFFCVELLRILVRMSLTQGAEGLRQTVCPCFVVAMTSGTAQCGPSATSSTRARRRGGITSETARTQRQRSSPASGAPRQRAAARRRRTRRRCGLMASAGGGVLGSRLCGPVVRRCFYRPPGAVGEFPGRGAEPGGVPSSAPHLLCLGPGGAAGPGRAGPDAPLAPF